MRPNSTVPFTPLIACPACRTPTLRPAEAEPLLPSRRCASCGGQFIRGEQYHRWLEHPDRAAVAVKQQTVDDATDSTRAKVCTECGKLMRRVRVGQGVAFSIDRCGACGGVWLDANEWEALRTVGLHDRLHFVVGDVWQARVLKEERDRVVRDRVAVSFGPEDFEEVQRIAEWIERHARRDEIAAYLLARLRAVAPERQRGNPRAVERFNRPDRCASPSGWRPRFVRALLGAWRSSARVPAGTNHPAR